MIVDLTEGESGGSESCRTSGAGGQPRTGEAMESEDTSKHKQLGLEPCKAFAGQVRSA